ncbi:MAG TPA: hypothetical protein VFG69_19400 [Nannocystaceae bacterium]|nr:hypothetical protein [Nannocystaceae bacterium]
MTWSVRDEGGDEAQSDRVLEDLGRLCRETCAASYPADEGFSVAHRRMSGALEGSSTHVVRGPFRAVVSVQRFERPGSDGVRATEIRVVASATRSPVTALVRPQRRYVQWAIAGCAAGTVALGLAALQIAGQLSTWAHVLALIPALMAWRMAMAMRLASEIRRQAALPPAHEPCSVDDDPVMRDEHERWNEVLAVVAAQRDATSERFGSRGFRSPGALPGTIAAFVEPPITPCPALPSLALSPLRRTTAL